MTPEHQLIQQIQQFTENDQIERSPLLEEFADQFAELCHDTNARLQRCTEYLDKGMRSEAVHEAQSPPALLDLVSAIEFEGLRKWRNICADLELPQAPQLATDTIERLKEECERESDLEPLLKEYRRFVYQGNREKCIGALRKLREKDPDNPSWAENLRPLEDAQLPSRIAETREALELNDLERLETLDRDLKHPQRVVQPPADLLADVKDALLQKRRQETGVIGERLASQIDFAAEEENGQRLETLLEEWNQLEDDEAFQPTQDMCERVGNAERWFNTYRENERRKSAFQELVQDTWTLLTNAPQTADIHHRRTELEEQPYDIPQDLAREMDNALTRIQSRGRNRRRLIATVIVLLVLAVLAAGASVWYRNQIRDRRTRMLARMEELSRNGKTDELDAYLKAVSERDPEFYNAPDIRHFRDDVAKLLQERAEKQKRFNTIIQQLDLIRKEQYATPEEDVMRLIAEATEAIPNPEAEDKLQTWKNAFLQWKDRKRHNATKELERIVYLVRRIIDQNQEKPLASFEAEEKALQEATPLIKEGSAFLEQADPKTVSAYNELAVQIDVWKRDLLERKARSREQEQKLEALRHNIPRALPDLKQYETLLKQFVNAFPEEPEADAYKRTLDYLPAWNATVALHDFEIRQLPGPPDLAQRIRHLLDTVPGLRNSAWGPDLETCLAYQDANAAVRQRIPLLLASKSETLNLQVLHYRPKGKEEWIPLYSPKPLAGKTEIDANGDEYKLYWGQVYYFEKKTDKPYLIHTSKVFPNNLNTKEFEIKVQKRVQDNLVGHGKFLYRFVADAGDAREMDVHVLHGIQQLVQQAELQLIPRAWLLKRLVHFLRDNFGDGVPEAGAFVNTVDKMNTDAPWMNPQHPAVLEAEKEIAQLLAGFPPVDPIIERLRTQRKILAAALSRKVRCVGSMQPGADKQTTPYWVGALPETVWILVANSPAARPTFTVAARRRRGGGILFTGTADKDHFPGQLLIAPGDGQKTDDILKNIVPDQTLLETLERPASWPVNSW